jgi:hypothetical protein
MGTATSAESFPESYILLTSSRESRESRELLASNPESYLSLFYCEINIPSYRL